MFHRIWNQLSFLEKPSATSSLTPLYCVPLEERMMLSATDPNDQISEAVSASIGDSITEIIDSGTDVDMYAVAMVDGQTVAIDIDSDGVPDELDSVLRVFDAKGNELAQNTYGNSGDEVTFNESYLLFTPESSGTYYIGVSGNFNHYDAVEGDDLDDCYGIAERGLLGEEEFFGGDTGNYTLNLDLINDDVLDDGDQITDATFLNGQLDAVVGATMSPGDVDMYRVYLDQGQTLDINVTEDFIDSDSSRIRVFSVEGFELDSNVGGDPNSLEFQAFTDDYYYIGISFPGNSSYDAVDGTGDLFGEFDFGSYDLTVESIGLGSVVETSFGLEIKGTFGDDRIEVRQVTTGMRILFDGVEQGIYTVDPGGTIVVDALAGDDEIIFQAGIVQRAQVSGGLGNDLIRTGAGHDSVFGGAGNDTIYGRAGDDGLYGDQGDDKIFGQGGFDFLTGDHDNDRLVGGSEGDFILGGDGEDVILGLAGDDTLEGGSQRDDINGGSGGDFICGGTGPDIILGVGGVDDIGGGSGDDIIQGNGAGDFIFGGFGDDEIDGGGGADVIDGWFGDDTLIGGVAGDDIYGGGGSDLILGGNDVDLIYAGTGDDEVDAGGGADEVYGEDGDDVIDGGFGNDILDGGFGSDTIDGQGGADLVFGGDDDDFLTGGLGNDLLDGGLGFDTSVDVGETEVSIEA